MQIRKATLNDNLLLTELSRTTFYDTYHAYNTVEDMKEYMEEYLSVERISSEISTEFNLFYIAENEGVPIGYIKLRKSQPPEEIMHLPSIEIARLYAIKRYHGKGIGKSLIQYAFTKSIEQQIEVMWLGVWQKNETAISFYKNFGFEILKPAQFVLGKDIQDDWIMVKHFIV